VIVGTIESHKGLAIVTEVARKISIRNLPIRLHVMGKITLTREAREDIGEALEVHGQYDAGRFTEMLGAIAPHVGWLPSQVPETWSYVLTDLMDAGMPVTATAIGAFPERCYGRPYTWLLPLEATASDWTDLFLRLHASRLEEPAKWVPVNHLPEAKAIYFDEYLRPESVGLSDDAPHID
jgi:hypothetical protein